MKLFLYSTDYNLCCKFGSCPQCKNAIKRLIMAKYRLLTEIQISIHRNARGKNNKIAATTYSQPKRCISNKVICPLSPPSSSPLPPLAYPSTS